MARKRIWAIWIKQTLLTIFLLFAAGFLFQWALYPEENDAIQAGAIVVAVYLVVGAGFVVINVVSHGLYLWLLSENDMHAGILDDLRGMQLPAPEAYHPRSFEYLEILADDPTADPNDRVKAAVLFGAYSAQLKTGVFRSLALRRALDNAVLAYSAEAPTGKKPPVQ